MSTRFTLGPLNRTIDKAVQANYIHLTTQITVHRTLNKQGKPMRDHFTEPEWTTLLQAPQQAIIAITLADRTDPVSFLQELKGGVEAVATAMAQADIASSVARALVVGIQQQDQAEALQGEQLVLKKEFELIGLIQGYAKAADGRDQAVHHFEQVAAVLSAKVTGDEGTAFKHWLMSLAEQVAQVSKESGFLGMGSRVSEKEATMLKRLAAALGLTP